MKITVTANEDFFDRNNQIPRVKGQQFEIKEEFAKDYGKQVTVNKAKDITMASIKKETPKASPKKLK